MVRTMITDAQKPIDLAVIDVAALYAASVRGRSKPPRPAAQALWVRRQCLTLLQGQFKDGRMVEALRQHQT